MKKTYFPIPKRQSSYSKDILLILFFLITTACGGTSSKLAMSSVNEPKIVVNETTSQCRLPSQIRRLSRQFTYLEPGRVVQTTLSDCKTRGGKMVSNI